MLDIMRKHAGSWMVKVLLGAIIIVFSFWGMGTYSARKSGRVALVNGETVTVEEYRSTYNRLVENLRRQFGDQLDDSTLEMMNVRKQAMDQVIDRALLLQEAERLKFRVSDDQLAAAIAEVPAFQGPSGFSRRRYEQVLSSNRLTPEAFELMQRQTMVLDRLRAFTESGVKVSGDEVRQMFDWQGAEINVQFVRFDPQAYTDIPADEDAVAAFFEERRESYKTQPKMNVRYLRFAPEDYQLKVTVEAEELQEYYEANPDEFVTPETAEASHILWKLDPDASDEKVESVRLEAVEVARQAREGADFAELARKHSEGPSKDRGGALGSFPRGAMVGPFEDAAFSMQAGEVSDPVRTRFGWHVIRLEKLNPQSVKPFEEARDAIRAKITGNRARNLAYDHAEEVVDLLFEEEDLEKTALDQELKLTVTESFSRQDPPKGLADGGGFAEAAFGLTEDAISDIVELSDGYYLLQAVGREEARIPELDTVREKVTADWVALQRADKAREAAAALLEKVRGGQDLAAAAEAAGLEVKETGWFNRNASIPEIGFESEINRQAFALSAAEPLPEAPLAGRQGQYVIRFLDRRAPAEEAFDKQREPIRNRLAAQKNQIAFQEMLDGVRSRSLIEIEPDYRESP